VESRLGEQLEMKEEDIKEPLYLEDIPLEIIIKSAPPKRVEGELASFNKLELLKKSDIHLHKSNSTSSIFIKDTISLPNIDELSRRMATKLHDMICKGHEVEIPIILDVFSEIKHPLTKGTTNYDIAPSIETIFHFLNTIFKVEKLSPEPGIMCLIYLERILNKTKK